MKIADDEFNRELSKYLTSRRTKGKRVHVQIYDAIKETGKKFGKLKFPKPESEPEIVDIPPEEEKEEPKLEEEYKELEDLEEEVREEKKSFWNILMNFFKAKEKNELEAEEKEEVEELKDEYDDLDEMEEDVEDLEEQIDEKKESIFKKLLNVFKAKPKNEVEEFDEMLELNEDVKDVIKTLTKWIKELPPEKIKQFKESDDFKKYKEVLSNYNLIKKEEKE